MVFDAIPTDDKDLGADDRACFGMATGPRVGHLIRTTHVLTTHPRGYVDNRQDWPYSFKVKAARASKESFMRVQRMTDQREAGVGTDGLE
jgi:hypothetical protein